MSSAIGFLRSAAGRQLDAARMGVAPKASDFHRPVLNEEAGNDAVGKALRDPSSMLVARMGGAELFAITYRSRFRRVPGLRPGYPRFVRDHLCNNAGFFPDEDGSLDRFCSLMSRSVRGTDVMAVWFTRNEHRFVKKHCPTATLVPGGCLESMRFDSPWTAALKGKKVLVVHPFSRSIDSQYRNNRTRLFANPDVLPEFELKTLQAVQSIAGNECGFKTWFDALDHMCEQILAEEFDVAIIGAGAYGLPLGAFVKNQGRQAVHLGGVTQILFGIKGRRWETEYAHSIGQMFNDAWVRPLPEEHPGDLHKVEEGCYW